MKVLAKKKKKKTIVIQRGIQLDSEKASAMEEIFFVTSFLSLWHNSENFTKYE